MRNLLLLVLSIIYCLDGFTQIATDHYLVEFTDKNASPYSIDHPEAFLSQKAIDRRTKYLIPVTSQDFPVNPSYVLAVKNIGVKIVQQTKWINAIVIKTADTTKLTQIKALPFVKGMIKNRMIPARNGEPVNSLVRNKSFTGTSTAIDYGEAFSQISMVGGIALHNQGYLGQGLSIAILDGGFTGTNFMKVFDSLRVNGQIKGTVNYVGGGTYVYQGTSHGSNVLSIMAANMPGVMVGTAPKADYYLLRTEDTNGENLIEEYNWETAAEYADSAGVDVISSSLSYIISSHPGEMAKFEELDGHTAPVTIAAEIAMSKGMIVVVSAGNNGQNQSWTHVGFPADGDSVFSIGAVDVHGIRAPFSSPGPTYDGRIKPEVMALGVGTTVMQSDNKLGTGNGTSFSTPIIAGLAACLWQAFPGKTNMEILSSIRRSASRHAEPDTLMGDGVPDFSKALTILGVNDLISTSETVTIIPNPFTDYFTVFHLPSGISMANVDVIDVQGKTVYKKLNISVSRESGIVIRDLSFLPGGIYLIRIMAGNEVIVHKLIKTNK